MSTKSLFARAARVAIASAVIGLGALFLTPSVAAAEQTDECASGSLDDCYTKDQMQEFLEISVNLVEGWFDELAEQGGPHPNPSAVIYIPTGSTAPSECTDSDGDKTMDDEEYAYCSLDDTIFIGQETLWLFYSEFGAAAPIVGLAHEYGHALQDTVEIPAPQSTNSVIKREDQADCIAGAWTEYIDDQGLLERVQDLTNIGDLLVAIGEMEGPDQTHGTPGERVGSFVLGFAGGLEACNAFFPSSSLTV